MDHAILVGFDLEIGQQVFECLEASGFKLAVAAWAILGEYGDARLVLASRSFNQQSGLAANREIYETLRNGNLDFFRLPPLLVLRMNDPFVRALRETFGGLTNTGLRPGPPVAGRSVDELYIYHIQKRRQSAA